MPTISQNKEKWGESSSEWSSRGDNWSGPWGTPESQWNTQIYPRIKPFLPASNILEIAPGYGRWTEFLRHHCDFLVGVDLNENCVRACKERFASDPRLSFLQNDGVSLAAIPDKSVDFIFSFDSLVHCERDVIEGYINQFPRILKPNGVAFIHHSNYAALLNGITSAVNRIPFAKFAAWRLGIIPHNRHWRAESVSAEVVREVCRKHGLKCDQELMAWDHTALNDCFTSISM